MNTNQNPADLIFENIEKKFGLTKSQIQDESRIQDLVYLRLIISYFLHQNNYSLGSIGRLLQREPSTIRYHIDKYRIEYKHNPVLRAMADQLIGDLNQKKIKRSIPAEKLNWQLSCMVNEIDKNADFKAEKCLGIIRGNNRDLNVFIRVEPAGPKSMDKIS